MEKIEAQMIVLQLAVKALAMLTGQITPLIVGLHLAGELGIAKGLGSAESSDASIQAIQAARDELVATLRGAASPPGGSLPRVHG